MTSRHIPRRGRLQKVFGFVEAGAARLALDTPDDRIAEATSVAFPSLRLEVSAAQDAKRVKCLNISGRCARADQVVPVVQQAGHVHDVYTCHDSYYPRRAIMSRSSGRDAYDVTIPW